jgi:predicted TIM-barrel fold metal-dependent hydrolase
VLRKFPTLDIALSEGGIGWIPWFLEKVDYVYTHHKAWTMQDFGDMLPSEVFKERFITCFIDDAFGAANLEYLNTDRVTWECDYPHSDSTWPRSPEEAMRYLGHHDDETIDKVTHKNSLRLFRHDLFKHIPRERCTVGALRAEAQGWDVSIRSMTTIERSHRGRGISDFAGVVGFNNQ